MSGLRVGMQHKPSELGVGAYFLAVEALVKPGEQVELMYGQQRPRWFGSKLRNRRGITDHAGEGPAKRNKANSAHAQLPHATCPLDDIGFKPCMSLSHSSH